MDALPEDLSRQVFTHASWTERRSDSYSRLAFLGDSVLSLAVTSHLYPRLEAERYGAGRLTKIRAQTVSGASCRAVAERLGVPSRLRANAPAGVGQAASALVETERVLASVTEAVIGACYLHNGYEKTAAAVVEAFQPEIEDALEHPVDLKSISLKGFKSFPDRTKPDFAPGVSVVVGPNGSGKSNITDAVLWAMGEQSPLAVRGQSMQDVIFAGAHGVQARSEAED